MSLNEFTVAEVQEFLAEVLKEKASTLVRKNLMKSFARRKVDGKTLVSLARFRAQREYRLGAYGVPKGIRAALIEAVKTSLAKSTNKKATKGRGKPKFIKTPDNSTVRDSPLAIARHMAKLDKRNKKTFDKNGWPKIEIVVVEKASAEERGFKESTTLRRTVSGFRKMDSEQVAKFVKQNLGRGFNGDRLAASIKRYDLTGNTLATICMDKCSKRRMYSFAAYRIRSSAAKELTKIVRASLDTHDMMKSSAESTMIRCPDGVRVRDSSVALAKYMATRYGSDRISKGLKIRVVKNGTSVEAEVVKVGKEKVLVRYCDFENGSEEVVMKDLVKAGNGKERPATTDESIPWDGTIVAPKSVRRAKALAEAGTQAPNLETATDDQIGAWAIAKVGGRNGARLAGVLRRSKMSGLQLLAVGRSRRMSGAFNAMAVPYSLRRSLAKVLRAEAKKVVQEEKPTTSRAPTFDGRGYTKMANGKKVRDSHVAMARWAAVHINKKAPFVEGFPAFEWVSGGYQPVLAMSTAELGAWVAKKFANDVAKDSLVKNLKKYNVDGEDISRICVKAAGINGRLTTVGVPFSLRRELVQTIRKATPSYKAPEKQTKMIVCPDGKLVRDSTVAIAQHLRWQRRGYTPRDETEWPEIEIITLEPTVKKPRKFTKAVKNLRKKVAAKPSGLPKQRKSQHTLDSHGWPEINLVVNEKQKERKVSFADLGSDAVEMWMREKLGSIVGIKVIRACVRRNRITAKSLALLATDNKCRNGRMAVMGIPFSLRKPLVQAIKSQEGIEKETAKKCNWIGMNMVSLPDGKTQIRDSAVSISRHYAKIAAKKAGDAKPATTNGWPAHELVENIAEDKKASHGNMLTMRMQGLARWAKETFKAEPEAKRLTKAILKFGITGKIIADVAHTSKGQAWRLGMYAIPTGLRQQVVKSVLAETASHEVPKARKTINVDGLMVRNSKIALILHMSRMQKQRGEGSIVTAPAEMQPDLLMMGAEEFAAWAQKKLRATKGYHSALSAALLRNRVNGKMFAELAVCKGNRNAKMTQFGVPKSNRKNFLDLAKRTAPPSAKKLSEKRDFVGLKKCTLPTGKTVRDSAVTIRRSMDRSMKKYQKTFDKNGWPKVEMVEKSEEVVQPKPQRAIPDKSKGFLIVGRSILPRANENSLLAGLPDDLRKFSVEEASRWVEAKMEDRFLARRFIRNRVSGLTLASLRDSKADVVGKLNMLGVPMHLRAKLVRAVRRDAGPKVTKPNPAKYWYSPLGFRVRNSMVAIAAHVYHMTGRVIDQNCADEVTDFKNMSSRAVGSWTSYALSEKASGRSAARSLRRLKVSGERLAYIVGQPGGRNDRLSAYGVPYSTRRPLVKAVKTAVPDRDEPAGKMTVHCPDGAVIRDSAISMARWVARQRKINVSQPKIELSQPSNAPVLAMRNEEVVAFLMNSRDIAEHPLRKSLSKRLRKMRVDGDMLAQLARKNGNARALMNVIGVPYSLMMPIVACTRSQIKTDKKAFATLYEAAEARNFARARSVEETLFKGFSKIKVEGKLIRDSAVAIASFLGRKHKITFKHEVEFVDKKAKSEAKADRLEKLTAEQVGEWISSNSSLAHVNQPALRDAATNLARMKVSGRALAEVCLSTGGRTNMLATFGIRKSIRRSLVKAVKEAMKDKKTGYTVIPSDGTKTARKKKEASEFIKAFQKAQTGGKKSAGWPDIELMHKAPVAKGGYQIVKSLLPRLDSELGANTLAM